jgi:prevent-host-death family protein
MITVGAFEAKTKFSELLDRVERGEEVVVTRHGKRVARFMRIDDDVERAGRMQQSAGALARLRALGAEIGSHNEERPITIDEVLEWRDEGRR